MITEALKAIAACLKEAGISYMVVGGQAVLQYGETRFTQDIDITLAVTPDEIEEVIKPLQSCGFSTIPSDYLSFLKDTWVLPVRHSTTNIRIDLIFSILPFERAAISNANEIFIDGAPVRFIAVEDLIVQKIFSGRPRDIEDAEGILKLNKERVDLKKIEDLIKVLSAEMADSSFLEKFEELKRNAK